MEEKRIELDCPPDPLALTESPRDSTGKISDVATFVTDLILIYDVLEYIGTVQQDESSTIKETSDDVAICSLSSFGSDS